ncbi:C4-dicarboxylate transporter [Heterobasidion irregulare TC 32-1]|uniref:C4-dicarboxylate transporter n=1 Tax=Heterobasidion irregulare (strain TC 32-1) TaxID=747525 RepID=W4K8G0_HETIT|nr:C4-dicarboxylate transporter [Heterobasidion irregulare TC 32-1]ETW81336.1 C4-dicarboxylate transporter [Heterobasidion irregulare TC 32-1]
MSPVWLLPVVTLIVASSSGGVLAQAIGPVSPSHALLTITFSIFLVSVGLSLALMILTIYLYRMILYRPPQDISSPFLGSTSAGDIVYAVCICIVFIMWSLATMWLVFALLSLQSVVRKTRFPFRICFWGMIFPNGVHANLTITLYRVLDVRFFRVWGAVYAVLTFAVWSIVFGQP